MFSYQDLRKKILPLFCQETIAIDRVSYAFKTGFNWRRTRKRTNRQRSSQEKRERGKGRAKEMTENSKKQCREVDLARARERLEKREKTIPSNAVKQIERGPEKRNKITKKLMRWANEKISPVRFWSLLQEVSAWKIDHEVNCQIAESISSL